MDFLPSVRNPRLETILFTNHGWSRIAIYFQRSIPSSPLDFSNIYKIGFTTYQQGKYVCNFIMRSSLVKDGPDIRPDVKFSILARNQAMHRPEMGFRFALWYFAGYLVCDRISNLVSSSERYIRFPTEPQGLIYGQFVSGPPLILCMLTGPWIKRPHI